MKDCIFCKISQGEIKSDKLYANDNFFSILDISPKVQGHALIISKKHFYNTLDLPNSIDGELLDCVKKTFFIVKDRFGAEGFNIQINNFGVAGQIVNHFHLHLIPRKKGDGVNRYF